MQNDLINQLALFQLVVPLGLMILNAVIPVAGKVGVLLRTATILSLLFYTALAGIWLFPPWWAPIVFALVQIAIAGWQLHKVFTKGPARSVWRIGEAIAALIAVIGIGLLILPAMQGRTPPDVAIDLAMPLGPGRYLVISGGAAPQINSHFFTLNLPRAVDFRGQSYGLDIIGINAAGLRTWGISPADPSLYEIYGADILAPCAGTVLVAIDGVPDNLVPVMNRDSMTGNSVVLECDGLAVVLAHFIPGSLTVAEGDAVEVGQKIAKVGNSGNSGEPHLHVHVQTIGPDDAPLSGDPLWLTIEDDFPVRNTRFVVRP
ncbi:peptidoglycan DD-metalloendopeptidase family protein [Mesorhizobium sp. NBSH29]|uniref:M23 family metallopeptidase n=1 Tax=Mesorhizobium sp. NBSH29 TaxID=2654249 RepID=UPI00189689A7|nr:M23 family metallopeptidase [Mesorhizobium sp. NBSH29]QPC86416.1 peptidoglycan DD-metalloendopeptidase family protein [Mesorhizobium sp. NBSH29]